MHELEYLAIGIALCDPKWKAELRPEWFQDREIRDLLAETDSCNRTAMFHGLMRRMGVEVVAGSETKSMVLDRLRTRYDRRMNASEFVATARAVLAAKEVIAKNGGIDACERMIELAASLPASTPESGGELVEIQPHDMVDSYNASQPG